MFSYTYAQQRQGLQLKLSWFSHPSSVHVTVTSHSSRIRSLLILYAHVYGPNAVESCVKVTVGSYRMIDYNTFESRQQPDIARTQYSCYTLCMTTNGWDDPILHSNQIMRSTSNRNTLQQIECKYFICYIWRNFVLENLRTVFSNRSHTSIESSHQDKSIYASLVRSRHSDLSQFTFMHIS
jgi:hypothetical protein